MNKLSAMQRRKSIYAYITAPYGAYLYIMRRNMACFPENPLEENLRPTVDTADGNYEATPLKLFSAQ